MSLDLSLSLCHLWGAHSHRICPCETSESCRSWNNQKQMCQNMFRLLVEAKTVSLQGFFGATARRSCRFSVSHRGCYHHPGSYVFSSPASFLRGGFVCIDLNKTWKEDEEQAKEEPTHTDLVLILMNKSQISHFSYFLFISQEMMKKS